MPALWCYLALQESDKNSIRCGSVCSIFAVFTDRLSVEADRSNESLARAQAGANFSFRLRAGDRAVEARDTHPTLGGIFR